MADLEENKISISDIDADIFGEWPFPVGAEDLRDKVLLEKFSPQKAGLVAILAIFIPLVLEWLVRALFSLVIARFLRTGRGIIVKRAVM